MSVSVSLFDFPFPVLFFISPGTNLFFFFFLPLIRLLLRDGQTSPSLSPSESFRLVAEDLPEDATSIHMDSAHGFTLYRRAVSPPIQISHETAGSGPGHWTPCIHFTLSTLSPGDIDIANYYNENAPQAPFMSFFVVSKLLPDGKRRTISFRAAPVDMNEGGAGTTKRQAKLYTKEGVLGEETDVEFVDFETGPIGEALVREFGFKLS